MQKQNYILFTILSLVIMQLTGCGESNKKSPPGPVYSTSIDEAKERGVFEFEVVLRKPSIELGNVYKLEVEEAWVEKDASKQVYVFGKPDIYVRESSHLMLRLKIIKTDKQDKKEFFYFLSGKPADILNDSLCHYYLKRTDTIKLPLYKQTSPELPAKKLREAYDSLVFIRKPINN